MYLNYQYLWSSEVYCSIKLLSSGKKNIYKYRYSLSLVWKDSSLELLMVFHSVWHQVEVICQHGPYRFYKTWCLVKEVFGDGASPIQDFVPLVLILLRFNLIILWLIDNFKSSIAGNLMAIANLKRYCCPSTFALVRSEPRPQNVPPPILVPPTRSNLFSDSTYR